ncbi:MAG: endonuclease/exonuclease/phosphatase family protein [Acidimicrobiales bacterium]
MPSSASVLSVVQLNIGSLLESGWEERRHEIVAWIRRLEPDVACFQEAWESDRSANTAGWLADEIGFLPHWVFGGFTVPEELVPGGVRFGTAMLSRFPIDDHAVHRLPTVDDGDPLVAGIGFPLLRAATAGLDVFVTHLPPAPGHGRHRIAAVLAIDELIRAARGDRDTIGPGRGPRAGMPPILCGDFNAEPESDEIRFLSSLAVLDDRTTYYQDAWRVAGAYGPGYTQDWRDNPQAARLNVHRKRIDYVFVGDPFARAGGAGRVLDCRVVFDTSLTGGPLASDHRGLVVEVVWPDRPG